MTHPIVYVNNAENAHYYHGKSGFVLSRVRGWLVALLAANARFAELICTTAQIGFVQKSVGVKRVVKLLRHVRFAVSHLLGNAFAELTISDCRSMETRMLLGGLLSRRLTANGAKGLFREASFCFAQKNVGTNFMPIKSCISPLAENARFAKSNLLVSKKDFVQENALTMEIQGTSIRDSKEGFGYTSMDMPQKGCEVDTSFFIERLWKKRLVDRFGMAKKSITAMETD